MATSRKVVEIISILVYFSSYLNSATVASSFFTTEWLVYSRLTHWENVKRVCIHVCSSTHSSSSSYDYS